MGCETIQSVTALRNFDATMARLFLWTGSAPDGVQEGRECHSSYISFLVERHIISTFSELGWDVGFTAS